jgi:hypothetical protein
MTIDQGIAVFSAAISFVGLAIVILQLREGNAQRKLESQIHLYDINRKLISLGFSHPQLFEVLKDAAGVDLVIERRYLQLWFNQLSLIHSFEGNGVFQREVQESFDVDLRDMLTMANMRRHWQTFGKYYPDSFQEAVNDILNEPRSTEEDLAP